ncbi:hypothetical protein [Phenylobacterium sp.]
MPPPEKPLKDAASEREAKLSQALRANLRRRKAGDRGATTVKPDRKSDGG